MRYLIPRFGPKTDSASGSTRYLIGIKHHEHHASPSVWRIRNLRQILLENGANSNGEGNVKYLPCTFPRVSFTDTESRKCLSKVLVRANWGVVAEYCDQWAISLGSIYGGVLVQAWRQKNARPEERMLPFVDTWTNRKSPFFKPKK